MPSVIIHIANEDPVMGEIDSLPSANDTIIAVKNPRRKDGKDVSYIEPNVNLVLWPMHRIQFIEMMPTGDEDEIISFVRE